MGKTLIKTSEQLVLKIPMRSYLVKYLNTLFGKNMKVTRHSWLGLVIIEILTKDYQKKQVAPRGSYF